MALCDPCGICGGFAIEHKRGIKTGLLAVVFCPFGWKCYLLQKWLLDISLCYNSKKQDDKA